MSDRLRLGDDATGPNEEGVGDRRLDRDAYVIPKNQYDAIAANGIEEFRGSRSAGCASGHVPDCCASGMRHTRCRRSAASASISRWQDAVAAANRLYPAFTRGIPTLDDLRAVQTRRAFPMKFVQGMHVFIQRQLIERILTTNAKMKPPFFMRFFASVPQLLRIPALIIGIGPRPEHIHTPERPERRISTLLK